MLERSSLTTIYSETLNQTNMTERKELLSAVMVGDNLELKANCSRQEMTALLVSLIEETDWFSSCLELAEILVEAKQNGTLDNLTPIGDA
jgi:hypothetical protein